MADENTDLEKKVSELAEKLEAAEAKNAGLLDDLKKAQREARAKSEIKPEDLSAAEERADKAEARAKELEKQVGTLTKERDGAVKALETEQGAARTYALDAEISGAIAAGQVVPALVPGLTALLRQQAKADLVDGKYAVQIGDKPASEYIKALLDSDDGKAYRAAPANGGGGAPGGAGATSSKTMTRADYDADPAKGVAFIRDGGKIVDQAA
jgi:uncharacterized protein YhaN